MIDWASQRNYPAVIVSQDASPLRVPSQPGIAKEKRPIVSGLGPRATRAEPDVRVLAVAFVGKERARRLLHTTRRDGA